MHAATSSPEGGARGRAHSPGTCTIILRRDRLPVWSPCRAVCGRARPLCVVSRLLAPWPSVAPAARVTSGEEERLPEVVVTAPPVRDGRRRRAIRRRFASVIDTRGGADARSRRSTDALSDTVGVQVRRFGGLGDFSTVSVRGFSPRPGAGLPRRRAAQPRRQRGRQPERPAARRRRPRRGLSRHDAARASRSRGPGGVVNVVTRRPGDDAGRRRRARRTARSTTRKATSRRGAAARARGAASPSRSTSAARATSLHEPRHDSENPATTCRDTRINNALRPGRPDGAARLSRRDPLDARAHHGLVRQVAGRAGRASRVHVDDAATATPSASSRTSTSRRRRRAAVVDRRSTAALFGLFQQRHVHDRRPRQGVPAGPTSTTRRRRVGGQRASRAARSARIRCPGVLVASSVERFGATRRRRHASCAPGTSPTRTRTRLTLAGEDEILLLGDRAVARAELRWEVLATSSRATRASDAAEQDAPARVAGLLHAAPRRARRRRLGRSTLLGNVGRTRACRT